jgi:superfamily II DNA or RNA helicase/HKD family nuclease
MPKQNNLKVYKGRAAKSTENTFFQEFAEQLNYLFTEKNLTGMLLGFPECKTNKTLALDVLLITKHAVLIIDFKNYNDGGTVTLPSEDYFDNGAWVFSKGDDEEIIVGAGSHNNPNPFKQVGKQRFKLIDIIGESIDGFNPRHLTTAVVFQNDVKIKNLVIRKWQNIFFVSDKKSYLNDIYNSINIISEEISLTPEKMEQIKNYFEAEEYTGYIEQVTSALPIKDQKPREISVAPAIIDNNPNTMEQSLQKDLKDAKTIDIATAYFYFSGFRQLAKDLKNVKMRILVGKAIDPKRVGEIANWLKQDPNVSLDTFQLSPGGSKTGRKQDYIDGFIELYNKSALSDQFDDIEAQEMQRIFEEKLKNGSLEIRMTEKQNQHGKFYVLGNGATYMGSSNFTFSGLKGQGEMNERFEDKAHHDEYSKKFETLWADGANIDIQANTSNDYFLKQIEDRLWLHSTPEPYKVFIRVLHEMYAESEELEEVKSPGEITGGQYSNLKYQLDAIKGGIDRISKYNGVIIADVVGLGKSIIASAIAHNLGMRTIIIVPPHLKNLWQDYVSEFNIPGAIVESGGKIEELHRDHATSETPYLYIIDEAHRYRNEKTQDYVWLHQLTRSHVDNRVVLLTATPYNNRPQDLFAMIKLFQTPSKSTLNTVDNLSIRFRGLISEYDRLAKIGKKNMTIDIKNQLEGLGAELRRMIEPVVIRRSRIDLKQIKEYAEDLKAQQIEFPEVVGPELIEYELGDLKQKYIDTLVSIVRDKEEDGFIGARYMPSTYMKADKEDEFRKKYGHFFDVSDLTTPQRNLASFMKSLLVQRFESSKYAFKSTLKKIRHSNEMIVKWWDTKGMVPILKKGELVDPEDESIEEIMEQIDAGANELTEEAIRKIKKIAVPIPKDYFKDEFISDVRQDIKLLEQIYGDWFMDDEIGNDPKLDEVREKIQAMLAENPDRKIVIFSMYADTAQYVYNSLINSGLTRTFFYYGSSSATDKQTVSANFDASYPADRQENNYDIIVATDALSEGFNLHRAGIIINYDIPYNPTRIVQRIGRINRINKKVFDQIYIYNCFPTAIGDEVVNIKGIATLKMLLINTIVGSDTKTLTADEDLKSYFRRQYQEADDEQNEQSWDNKYRNVYDSVKHNQALLKEVLEIPERTRIVRNDQKENSAVSFAKRGNGLLFAVANVYDIEASIVAPETALPLFDASPDEKSSEGDASLDKKFKLLRDQIMTTQPAPVVKGTRAEALTNIRFLRDNYTLESDFLSDLHDIIKNYDDLSDGEMKFIRQLNITNQEEAVESLKEKFSIHYLDNIKKRADGVDRATEIIMFTEDLRK